MTASPDDPGRYPSVQPRRGRAVLHMETMEVQAELPGKPDSRRLWVKTRDRAVLISIILVAAGTRVMTLWVGRPEFTGWLNHTYYYFVQVRGLLDGGSLPYPDMPLLFGLYASIARILGLFGTNEAAAIVAATRLVMCLVLSLLPIPFYLMARRIDGDAPLRTTQWILIFSAGFLPLSIQYMPEYLQKNTAGLLLLAFLLYYSLRLFARTSPRDLVIAGVLVAAIAVTHFGTLAAMILYGVAAFLALLVLSDDRGQIRRWGIVLAITGAFLLASIRALDPQRALRILVYLKDSLRNSLLLSFFISGNVTIDGIVSLGIIAVFYAVLLLLYRIFRVHQSSLTPADRVFWLANLLFAGLLLLPIMDQRLMGRLALFLSLPMLVVFLYIARYALGRPWARIALNAVVLVGVVVLAFGEVVSSRIHNRNNERIAAELRTLRAREIFSPDDLIITTAGAEHVCNWFFGVRAGVITSLNIRDFQRYRHVFVLNPTQGKPDLENLGGKSARTDMDRDFLMHRNIPKPPGARLLFRTPDMELFELVGPPAEWSFAPDGSWTRYSKDSS